MQVVVNNFDLSDVIDATDVGKLEETILPSSVISTIARAPSPTAAFYGFRNSLELFPPP
jgi:hypothetical protein